MKLSDRDLNKFGNTVQLIGGVWAGDGEVYLCLFPEEHGDVLSEDGKGASFHPGEEGSSWTGSGGLSVNVLNMGPDEWERFLRQTDIMETEILAKAKDGSLVKAIARKSSRQIDQNVSWRVFKRDGYACRYCGRDDVPLTVDHLVRWEEAGPSIEANLLSSCRKCNRTRGNQYYDDWLRSGYYKQVSSHLSPEVREANVAVAATLDAIPRKAHVHTR
jgi:HNH endonuclease